MTSSARILTIGDSISGDLLQTSFSTLSQSYGYGGVIGGSQQFALYTGLSGGVTRVNGNYGNWVTGTYYQLPPGESVAFARSGSVGDRAAGFAGISELEIHYLTTPGGGSFRVQAAPLDSNGQLLSAYADISGYTAVQTDALQGIDTLRIPVPAGSNLTWRIVANEGPVSVVNSGWLGSEGLIFDRAMSLGGTLLTDYASTPAEVWASYLQTAPPDLVILMAKDGATSGLRDALETIQGYIYSANPDAHLLLVGAYHSAPDDLGYPFPPPPSESMTAQNAIFEEFALDSAIPGNRSYWDAGSVIGEWTTANAAGWFSDTVHLNDAGQKVLGDQFLADFGLIPVPEPSSVVLAISASVALLVALQLRLRRKAN